MAVRWLISYRRTDGSLGEQIEDVDTNVPIMQVFGVLRGRVSRSIHEDDFTITRLEVLLEQSDD